MILGEKDGIVLLRAAGEAAAAGCKWWFDHFHSRSVKVPLAVHGQVSAPEQEGLGGKEISVGIDSEASQVVVVASTPEGAGSVRWSRWSSRSSLLLSWLFFGFGLRRLGVKVSFVVYAETASSKADRTSYGRIFLYIGLSARRVQVALSVDEQAR